MAHQNPAGVGSQAECKLSGPACQVCFNINMNRLVLQASTGPPGLVTLADGSIDQDFYVKKQGMHPSFITGLKEAMAGAHRCAFPLVPARLSSVRMHLCSVCVRSCFV